MFGNNADTMLHSTHIFKLTLLKIFSELSPFQRRFPDQNNKEVTCLKRKKKDVKRKNLFQLFPGCFNEEPARKEGTGSSSALRPENRAAESGGYFLL